MLDSLEKIEIIDLRKKLITIEALIMFMDKRTLGFIKQMAKNHRENHSNKDNNKQLPKSKNHSKKLKRCPLCEELFKPKKNQKYCEICREIYYPMYKDLKKGRIPFYPNGVIKTPAIPLPDKVYSIIYDLIFVQASIQLDFSAMLGYRSAERLGELAVFRMATQNFISGTTSGIVNHVDFILSNEEDEIINLNESFSSFLNSGGFDELIGDIYIKTCEKCGEPLLIINQKKTDYKDFFVKMLNHWAPEKVIGKNNIDYIKKGLEEDMNPQTKYHHECLKEKKTDYQRDYKRKLRQNERQMRSESMKKAYEKHGSVMLHSSTGRGTSSLGSHMKENAEDEIKEIEAEFRKLGLNRRIKKFK